MTEISNAQTKKPTKKPSAIQNQPAANLPKVTQIDAEGLKKLIKPNGKPLLINFWATWCDPCREEFPDLVKIASDYKDKIDLITVSLDDLAEINRDVPKFLAQMKSDSPAYLLKTPDEGAAMALVAPDWQGALPFTILFDASGAMIYSRQGKFKTETLRMEIDKAVGKASEAASIGDIREKVAARRESEESKSLYQAGSSDAQKDALSKKLKIIRYGEGTVEKSELKKYLKTNYGIEMLDFGCKLSNELLEYIEGYNKVSEAEIKRKFGDEALAQK